MKVTIIQRILPHYRVPLFQLLRSKLEENGIDFQLVYGQEYPGTVPKTVLIKESWAHYIDNQYFTIASKQLVWQPCLDVIQDSDLLIFEQANFLILNFFLLLNRKCGGKLQLAYWGHGKNMQAVSDQSLSGRLKKAMIHQVDWWFAYTNLTEIIISDAGFSKNRITVLQNAIDTTSLKKAITCLSQSEIDQMRKSLGLLDAPVALFCGGMYENKKLDFLIESCNVIRQRVPDFQLLMIGDGPEQYKAQKAVERYEWIHYLGPQFGMSRAIYFKIADIFLMPGLVGLAILDGFVAGLPMFTTDIPIHSPEIAYLKNGENGFLTENSIKSYSDSVCSYVLSDIERKKGVEEACLASAESFTLENMAERFAEGIQFCLAKEI